MIAKQQLTKIQCVSANDVIAHCTVTSILHYGTELGTALTVKSKNSAKSKYYYCQPLLFDKT